MNLSWGDSTTSQFITNVGLITSDGVYGPNIMSAEWTYLLAYKPATLAVSIGKDTATFSNIRESKEFGVSLCSSEQSVMASVSGTYTGKNVDKIAALGEIGFTFYQAKKIRVPMVSFAAANIECELSQQIIFGENTLLIGGIIESSVSGKDPLAYHRGAYWTMNHRLERSSEEDRKKVREIVESHRKENR
ncbi:MAG: flavin reductase family protein [Thaumarchaeota archaeon]|nr:flavin reductase family protein [Nitrososphaerota archaeon]